MFKCSVTALIQANCFPTNLFEGEGRRLATTNFSDRHPLAVDGFNGNGDEDAKWVWSQEQRVVESNHST